MSLNLSVVNTSGFHFVIVTNGDTAHAADLPVSGSVAITVVAGDAVKAYNHDSYNPSDLTNGALLYQVTIPDGCSYSWVLADLNDTFTVTAASCAPTCENAVSCDCESPFQVTPPHPPPPPIIFWNTQQSATATCPAPLVGSTVTITIAANLYSSTVSQQDANNIAYAVALSQAQAALNCGLAGQLNGLRWEMPCTGPLDGSGVCACVDPADNSQVAQGTPGQTYTVQLRVRGLVELKRYAADGVAGAGNGHVFLCTNPAQAIPAAGGDVNNEYMLQITDPPAAYFLNNTITGLPPAGVEKMDYQLTVRIKTGGVIRVKARSIDNFQFGNPSHLVVNNQPPALGVVEPYGGEWVQIDVISIV